MYAIQVLGKYNNYKNLGKPAASLETALRRLAKIARDKHPRITATPDVEEIVRNRGRHEYNGKFQLIEVVDGLVITKTRSGTVGGVTESHDAQLTSPNELNEDELAEIAKKAHLASGSVFQEMPPLVEKTDSGYVYKWSYSPSTE